MRRPAAATHRPAAAVEEGHVHAPFVAGGDDILLRRVEFPRRGQTSAVLGRVGIADHYLLAPSDAVPVPGNGEELSHARPSAAQVAHRLEQRYDAERRANARRRLKQLDCKDIGRSGRHRDDVRAKGVGMEPRRRSKGVEHITNLGFEFGTGLKRVRDRAAAFS